MINGPIPSLTNTINNPTAGRVQVMHDAAIALRRDPIQLARGVSVRFGKIFLRVGALFVVILIAAFDRLAADQSRDETRFVRSESGQHAHAQVNGHKQSRINARLFRL